MDPCCSILLDDMCELMRQQPSACRGMRRKLASTEDDGPPNGVSKRIYSPRRLGGSRVVVQTHVAEVFAKGWFHGRAQGRIQLPAWRAQYVVDDLRGRGELSPVRRMPPPELFFFALETLSASCRPPAGTLSLQDVTCDRHRALHSYVHQTVSSHRARPP